jgi:hypothetical protein
MSIEIKAAPMNRRPARDVLLAGLGAVSLLRKNAGSVWTEATAIAARMPEATSILVEGVVEGVVKRGNAFRYEFERVGRQARKETSAAASKMVADVESRLQPLLRKFSDTTIGLGIVVARPKANKAAAKRTSKIAKLVAKRTARKPRKAA